MSGTVLKVVNKTAHLYLRRRHTSMHIVYDKSIMFAALICRKNELVDDKALIRRLRQRITQLDDQVAQLKGERPV